MNNTLYCILLVAVAAIVTLLLRALPFLVLGGKRQMPERLKKTADLLPPAIMGVLVIYCLKDYMLDINVTSYMALISVAAVVALHLWKRNTLLSIAVGTVLYMLLIRL